MMRAKPADVLTDKSSTAGRADARSGLISEKTFQQQIVDLARRLGYLVYHTYDSRRSVAGFPDLVLCRGGRLVFAELKSQKGRLTEAQRDWLARLRVAGSEAYLWRPDDWDTIIEILTARRRPAGYHAYRLHGEGTATRLLAEVDA